MNTQANFIPKTEARPEGEEAASTLNAPRLAPESEVESFLASGDTLYRKHRDRMQRAHARYQSERYRLVADYERRVQGVINEAKDTVRGLDQAHQKAQAEGRRMLDALALLRDG